MVAGIDAQSGDDAHGAQEAQISDQSLVEVVLRSRGHLHVPCLLGDRELDARLPARVDDPVAFGHVERHRLLEVDVLACSGGGERERQVRGVRRGDDRDVDVMPAQERLGRRFRVDAVLLGELACPGAQRDRRQSGPLDLGC